MRLCQLYHPTSHPMRVAGFMSGSGSNIRKLIEASEKQPGCYEISVIFSNNAESKAVAIGRDFDIPVIVRGIREYYKKRGKPLRDMGMRQAYDQSTLRALSGFGIDVIAYGGYMSVVSPALCRRYLGINVHPADLSITKDQKRAYIGDKAVQLAINSGEKTLRSSTHIIEPDVDQGRILMISAPVEVLAGETPDEAQNRLKEKGDWVIFPKTLEYLADGRFAEDEEGKLYFDGKAIPDGVRLE